MSVLTPSCVWRCRADIVLALDERLGEPVDTYVNGSQVWLLDNGPGGVLLEWRLHPVGGFRRPPGVSPYELLEQVVFALRTGEEPPLAPEALWGGLEAFPAYGDEVEPAPLAAACTEALGLAPDAYGLVDHGALGDQWERSEGRTSIVDALLDAMAG